MFDPWNTKGYLDFLITDEGERVLPCPCGETREIGLRRVSTRTEVCACGRCGRYTQGTHLCTEDMTITQRTPIRLWNDEVKSGLLNRFDEETLAELRQAVEKADDVKATYGRSYRW